MDSTHADEPGSAGPLDPSWFDWTGLSEQEFSCCICAGLLQDAVQTKICGHLFCESCLRTWRRHRCPLCNQALPEGEPYFADLSWRRRVNQLKARCQECGFTACWEGQRTWWSAHALVCASKHTCEFCAEALPVGCINRHYSACPEAPRPERKPLPLPDEYVPCNFVALGCPYRGQRGDTAGWSRHTRHEVLAHLALLSPPSRWLEEVFPVHKLMHMKLQTRSPWSAEVALPPGLACPSLRLTLNPAHDAAGWTASLAVPPVANKLKLYIEYELCVQAVRRTEKQRGYELTLLANYDSRTRADEACTFQAAPGSCLQVGLRLLWAWPTPRPRVPAGHHALEATVAALQLRLQQLEERAARDQPVRAAQEAAAAEPRPSKKRARTDTGDEPGCPPGPAREGP